MRAMEVRKALKPEDYARALHDIALAQGVKLVQEILNELLDAEDYTVDISATPACFIDKEIVQGKH